LGERVESGRGDSVTVQAMFTNHTRLDPMTRLLLVGFLLMGCGTPNTVERPTPLDQRLHRRLLPGVAVSGPHLEVQSQRQRLEIRREIVWIDGDVGGDACGDGRQCDRHVVCLFGESRRAGLVLDGVAATGYARQIIGEVGHTVHRQACSRYPPRSRTTSSAVNRTNSASSPMQCTCAPTSSSGTASCSATSLS